MEMFWEFFVFRTQIPAKSLPYPAFSFGSPSTSSTSPASWSIGNTNGKILLSGPYANIYNDIGVSFFGIIVIAAIFGTSILRDFQRDTIQILFTKPISKFAYLGGRWAGSFIATIFAFSGLLFGEFFGTLAPWADHVRIGPNHLATYLQPFFSIVVFQIFFLEVSLLPRRPPSRCEIFIVYLRGRRDLFMLYLISINAFSATRSLEHFWSGILDPVFLYSDAIGRYWTVVERNTQLYHGHRRIRRSLPHNRLLWGSIGILALLAVWRFFPMSVEALTARSSVQARRPSPAHGTSPKPKHTAS